MPLPEELINSDPFDADAVAYESSVSPETWVIMESQHVRDVVRQKSPLVKITLTILLGTTLISYYSVSSCYRIAQNKAA